MYSLVKTLSFRYQAQRLADLTDDFNCNGDDEHAKALQMLPHLNDAFFKQSEPLHNAARLQDKDLLCYVVDLMHEFAPTISSTCLDLQGTEAAGQTLAVFFVFNFFTDSPILPPSLSQKKYSDAVMSRFPDACVSSAQKRGRYLIKLMVKRVFLKGTPKSILCGIVESALFAFFPIKGEGALAFARSGACMVICLALGLQRKKYVNSWLRKVVDEEVSKFKKRVKEGHVLLPASAALSNTLAASLKRIASRPTWRSETISLLHGLKTRKVGLSDDLVPVTHEMMSSKLTSASTCIISKTVDPRDEFFVTLLVSLCEQLGMKTKKSHVYDWRGIERAMLRMPAALRGAQDKAASKGKAAEARGRLPTARRGFVCVASGCSGVPVIDARSGDRTCHACGLVSGRGVHGGVRNFIDKETKTDYRQHVENTYSEERTQLTCIDQSHCGSRGLNVAFRKVRDGRARDDLIFGMKKATPEIQKKTARVIFGMLVESSALPVDFASNACAYFNAYRDGPGANAMNFYEVVCAAGLCALPPEHASCIGVCETVFLIAGVPLPNADSMKIAEYLGNQRGGLKTATLAGTQLNLLGQSHVFRDVGGHTVVVPCDTVLRFHGMLQLPDCASLRIYATCEGKIVSQDDLVVHRGGRFRGTLAMSRSADALHIEVFSTTLEYKTGCLPKRKKSTIYGTSYPFPREKWCFQEHGVSLAMSAWHPRLTQRTGCGTRFTTLYDMKRHVCCASVTTRKRKYDECRRKRRLELSGRKKMRRI